MTFLEALYGSQFYEIHQKGRDGNKGRMNGNLLLSALIILLLFALILVAINFVPGFNESITNTTESIFGNASGKTIGKILGIAALGLIYLVINFTIGNQQNFNKRVEKFMQYPDEIKKKANAKLLIPFFVLLAIVLMLAFIKL
jgi:hypothetical protein